MIMQGSIAVSPSPVMMENFVFRQKLALSLCTSGVQLLDRNSSNVHSTARCLFGPPDPKQAKDLVREVDSQNAINFGKRFNFDIVSGEPIPSAKRMRMSHVPETNDSDEENVAIIDDDDPEEGYIWAETYDEDYMAMCNKHTVSSSIVGPNRHVVSLLIAPITNNHTFCSSASSSYLPTPSLESPLNILNQSTFSSQKKVHPSSSSFSSSLLPPSESNNNTTNEKNNNEDKKSAVKHQEKRNIRSSRMHHNHHHNQPSAKKTSLSSLTKYTNRVLKHAVMKKTRKNIITDYLHMRRVKNAQAGKK